MGKYTPTFTATTEFDGDKVTVTLNRMKRKHMTAIAGKVVTDAQGKQSLNVSQSEMMSAMEGVMRECIVKMEGPYDAVNLQVSIDTVLDDLYFFKLAMWILGELMEGSRLTGDEEKNSPALPADPQPGAA